MNMEVGVPGVDTPSHITASRRILAAILATMFVSGVITGVADERQLGGAGGLDHADRYFDELRPGVDRPLEHC
jgi:hypothetical protein